MLAVKTIFHVCAYCCFLADRCVHEIPVFHLFIFKKIKGLLSKTKYRIPGLPKQCDPWRINVACHVYL